MSLPARLMNVFAVPGDVFAEVKAAPVSHANWLVPAILLMVVSWLAAFFIFSQPAIQQQISELAQKGVEKQIQKMKVTGEQAEKMRQAAEKFGSIGSKVSAVVFPLVVALGSPFFWGFILWLGSKVFKGPFRFLKAVEVAGLAGTIGVLHSLIKSLLVLALGNVFASPSLALLVKEFNQENWVHGLLGAVNPFTFWYLAVLAIGLARLGGIGTARSAIWVFGIWAVITGFFMGVGFAMRAAFGG
jgi:hypothetical protein